MPIGPVCELARVIAATNLTPLLPRIETPVLLIQAIRAACRSRQFPVRPALIPQSTILAGVQGAYNAIWVRGIGGSNFDQGFDIDIPYPRLQDSDAIVGIVHHAVGVELCLARADVERRDSVDRAGCVVGGFVEVATAERRLGRVREESARGRVRLVESSG